MSKYPNRKSDGNFDQNDRHCQRQVSKLMADYYDDQLCEAEIRELGKLIDSDPELFEEFAAQGYFHAQLYHIVLGNEFLDNNESNFSEREEVISEKTSDRLPPVDLGDSGEGLFASYSITQKFLHGFSWIGILLLSCMAIGFACLFVGVENDDPNNGSIAKSNYIAELTWLGATNEKGDYLHSPTASTLTEGKTLLIQHGNVHVKFACGAEVTLHGPAVFHIETEKLARLEYGSLEAKVPPEAIGFLIDTPASRVIDLGTEFAVSVADNGNTNINVINGEVETESWRPNLLGVQPRRKLFEGDSLRLSPPVIKSFRTDFDTPNALDVFDIVRHDPATCLLDPVAGLLTLKPQTGTIYKDQNNNSNILVVPIPDCNFDAILKVKRFEPRQPISHVSLATLDDQDNVYRISYWMSFRNYKRGLTSTKEENTQHSFVRNNKGQEDTLFDAGDRPFKLRIVRKESTISTYWSEESGPWVSNGEMPCKFKPRFIGFFAAEPNPSKGQNRELIDCVIDSFELKLVTPER